MTNNKKWNFREIKIILKIIKTHLIHLKWLYVNAAFLASLYNLIAAKKFSS